MRHEHRTDLRVSFDGMSPEAQLISAESWLRITALWLLAHLWPINLLLQSRIIIQKDHSPIKTPLLKDFPAMFDDTRGRQHSLQAM